jgi:hypothetical protein
MVGASSGMASIAQIVPELRQEFGGNHLPTRSMNARHAPTQKKSG